MSAKLDLLSQCLHKHLGEKMIKCSVSLGEITVETSSTDLLQVASILRTEPDLGFEELIDLCGVDYSTYANDKWLGKRFAVVSHFLSVSNNWRLRLRVFANDNLFPSIPSLVEIWNSANWYERESFDLYGIVFPGHPDLRRILTDYGFIGHPFRKDFPVSGYVEMRYDPAQSRVVYQPVSIEPREVTPRIVRESNYGGVNHG